MHNATSPIRTPNNAHAAAVSPFSAPYTASQFLKDANSPALLKARSSRREVTTTSATKRLISCANEIIHKTREFFPHGPGNQRRAIERTMAQSYQAVGNARSACYERSGMREELSYAPKTVPQVMRMAAGSMVTAGGNCAEHAYVSFALARELAPVGTSISIATFPGVDHVFVLMGKMTGNLARDQENVVVIDAWPIYAEAVLLKDFEFFHNQAPELCIQMHTDGVDAYSRHLQNIRVTRQPPRPLSQASVERLVARGVYDRPFAGKEDTFYRYNALPESPASLKRLPDRELKSPRTPAFKRTRWV